MVIILIIPEKYAPKYTTVTKAPKNLFLFTKAHIKSVNIPVIKHLRIISKARSPYKDILVTLRAIARIKATASSIFNIEFLPVNMSERGRLFIL